MTLMEKISGRLTDPEWGFGPGPSENSLVTMFEGDSGKFIVAVTVREPQQQLAFYAYSPVEAPEDKLPAMMELLTRANHGMILGNFELDLADGEVRFKVSIDVEKASDPLPLVDPHLSVCIMTMDQYLPAILAVISGEASPEEALALAEEDDEDVEDED